MSDRRGEVVNHRFRLLAGCLVLVALAFVQSPQRIVADTKLDLAIDPLNFLSRAATMWEPNGFFGQVQNQAYGYLFPMGPFFGLGHVAQVEPWIVQRLWWGLVLCVAFTGMVTLCRALDIGSPRIQIAGGLLFALSPRFLTVLGPSSIEVWPSALAPWVLIPLVIGLRRRDPRHMAAFSAVAVACVGGVNAAATFAVIPLGAIWLLMAPASARRRTLMWWWPPLVLLGTLWWLVPLFLLGGYSPPFLDYIESSSVTTTAATVVDGLRGTTNWVPYINDQAVAGRSLITEPLLILNTAVVVALGLLGLAMRDLPHRRFLVVSLGAGLVLLTAGHTGNVQGLFADGTQSLLDGALAPLRNTHKFDVVVRLPLLLAATHAITVLRRRSAQAPDFDLQRAGVAMITVAALIGGTSPAWSAGLANRGTFTEIPGYWEQTSDWLADNDSGDTALVVPSSAFADYVWGNTSDEPLQALSRSSWAVRNSVPLTQGATIKMLDAVGDELASGRRSEGLGAALRRAGVGHLVVRSDLEPSTGGDRSEVVWETLQASPGVRLAATFGPQLGGDGLIDLGEERTFSQGGWRQDRAAVGIFEVTGITTTDAAVSAAPTVVGDAASVTRLETLGLLGPEPVVTAQDRPADSRVAGPLILTDGARRQEYGFGSVDRARSATLGRNGPYSLDRRVHDYDVAGDAAWESVSELLGAASLRASSSRSFASATGGVAPSAQPWSAFDGDLRSQWEANGPRGTLTLDLSGRKDLGRVSIRSGVAPGVEQDFTVTTEDGPVNVSTIGDESAAVDIGRVGSLEVTGVNRAGDSLAVAEISGTALTLERPLRLPVTDKAWGAPATIALGLSAGQRPACLRIDGTDRCRAGQGERGEDAWSLDRQLMIRAAETYTMAVTVRPVGGTAYDSLVQRGLAARVSASSSVNDDVRASASSLIDGDRGSAWIADPDDTDPTVTVRWDEPQTFASVEVPMASGVPASRVDGISLETDDGRVVNASVVDGVASFDEVTTRTAVIHLQSAEDARDVSDDDVSTALPVGIGELQFDTAETGRIRAGDSVLSMPCGSGPTVRVGGRDVKTKVAISRDDFAAGEQAKATPCTASPIDLTPGTNRVTARASAWFSIESLQLTATNPVDAPTESGSRYVVREHNANAGWEATSTAGQALRPVRMNGWQQGYRVPSGESVEIRERYAPGGLFAGSLLAGGVGLLALLVLALLPWRRRRALPEVGASVVSGGVVGVTLAAALVLLIGGWAVPVGLAAAGTVAVASRLRWSAVGVVTIPWAVAVLAYLIRPWGGFDAWAGEAAWPHLAAGYALALVFAFVLRDLGFRARKGSST